MNHPVIVLVEPQLAENIGMVARAMANFGLSELRLVAPRNGWPKKGAHSAASGATHILDGAKLYDTVRDAIADLHYVFATTARERGQMKRVFGPEPAMAEARRRIGEGQGVGILFGRERTGLENDEVSLADAIVTFPVDPRFSSLNLAQAVLLMAYEWQRHATGGTLPFGGREALPASRETLISFFDYIEGELDAVSHFPEDKRPVMVRNMRDIFHRLALTEQDVRTLRGAIRALAEGRRLRNR
ncbi:RNA methyltransferase [Microvirga thermotolerans]|uniref:tRNA (cytidine/uridine-2'-O-)-methyltransferase TrmJ n=1 Tax=Microvirga thermotolerans TaxID=2651334 RepID=A0A5P9JTP4_9HYPH|nr:RNA methyltransferase [Microvirga thermotolerans]QFU15997.1 TrmJ/YjtD family RNA methyltransferase [Microvirga thermotolerans]